MVNHYDLEPILACLENGAYNPPTNRYHLRGIACDATNADAVEKVHELKQQEHEPAICPVGVIH
ncbi:MAG: hypothetical protein R2788_18220 [Saprospiraceae bacterium]